MLAWTGEAMVRWWEDEERKKGIAGMGWRGWRGHTAKRAPEQDVVRVEHVFTPRRLRATGMISDALSPSYQPFFICLIRVLRSMYVHMQRSFPFYCHSYIFPVAESRNSRDIVRWKLAVCTYVESSTDLVPLPHAIIVLKESLVMRYTVLAVDPAVQKDHWLAVDQWIGMGAGSCCARYACLGGFRVRLGNERLDGGEEVDLPCHSWNML